MKPDFTKHWETRQYTSPDETISFTINANSAVICSPAGDLVLPIAMYEQLLELECDAAADKLRQAIDYRRQHESL
jgi:hypothetical protein